MIADICTRIGPCEYRSIKSAYEIEHRTMETKVPGNPLGQHVGEKRAGHTIGKHLQKHSNMQLNPAAQIKRRIWYRAQLPY